MMKNAMILLAMATIMLSCQQAEDEVFFTEEGFEEVALSKRDYKCATYDRFGIVAIV